MNNLQQHTVRGASLFQRGPCFKRGSMQRIWRGRVMSGYMAVLFLNFLRTLPTVFHRGCATLVFTSIAREGPFSSHPCQHDHLTPGFPLLGASLKEMTSVSQRDPGSPSYCHIIHTSQDTETMCSSVNNA